MAVLVRCNPTDIDDRGYVDVRAITRHGGNPIKGQRIYLWKIESSGGSGLAARGRIQSIEKNGKKYRLRVRVDEHSPSRPLTKSDLKPLRRNSRTENAVTLANHICEYTHPCLIGLTEDNEAFLDSFYFPKTARNAVTPIVFLHGLWMERYDGWEPNIYAGGFKWPAQHDWGGELLNFRSIEGNCYGYVEVHPRKLRGKKTQISIRLENLGAEKTAKSLGGVLVVWTAPNRFGRGRKIIGWYRNATLYRSEQEPEGIIRRKRTEKGQVLPYRVKARDSNCTLLSPEARTLTIPPRRRHHKGLPGQSSVYFPTLQKSTEAKRLLQRVLDFIDTGETAPAKQKQGHKNGRQQDPERRKAIESAAIEHVKRHFEQALRFRITDRQKDNVGYDLEALKDDEALCIEVKGCSGTKISSEFTVNEYEKIRQHQNGTFTRGSYRICVVTDALGESSGPSLHHFFFDRMDGANPIWRQIEGPHVLVFETQLAARITTKGID